MDKGRVHGSATNMGGKLIFDQIKGRFQNAIGGIKDALRRK
jgi:hypothetical protein